MNDRKILMIINEFPPVAESGVQRPLKFLKYLNRLGWHTWVITPKVLPKKVLDATLCGEIPPNAMIYRTPSLGLRGTAVYSLEDWRDHISRSVSLPKRLFWLLLKVLNDATLPYDKQIGWVPFAYRQAVQLIRRYDIRSVYITAYPFSSFVIGLWLKRRFGDKILWVADYRDAWQFEPIIEKKVLPFRRRLIVRMDAEVLSTADRIVFTTDYIRRRYLQAYPSLAQKSSVITNGYDEDDFTGIQPRAFDRFTFLYMGKIYANNRNPLPLLRVLKQFGDYDFQYIHIGTIGSEIHNQIRRECGGIYDFQGYKTHAEALSHALGADVNVIIINDDEESTGVFSGKLFELLRAGKPILALGPQQSIIRDMLEQTHTGIYVWLEDTKSLAQALQLLLNKEFVPNPDLSVIQTYSRQKTAEALSRLLTGNRSGEGNSQA